ncbi:MAG: pentose kinase [Clostridia bacterium]|nr:pentose kinase [Clostridia bacterium]
MPYVLSYDLGTSGIKASLFDENASCLKQTVAEYPTSYRTGGICEQSPKDWWSALKTATASLISEGIDVAQISAIGLSGHSLGVVAIDKNGNLLSEQTPIWSDARAVEETKAFFSVVDEREWYETTGCGLSSHLYSVFKIMWYQKHEPTLYQNAVTFFGTKDYINFCLTGVIATDHSYASGSGVYDLQKRCYRTDWIAKAGLDADKFPPIFESDEVIGTVRHEIAAELGLPSGVAVVGGGVDNACMTLGAGCCEAGDTYASLGSSAWISMVTDHPKVDFEKRLYTWAHCVKGMYIPSAGIYSAGTSLSWVKKNLLGEQCEDYALIETMLATSPVGANGVIFCPVMAGGSPMDIAPDMKGAVCGIDLSIGREDILRAVYEGMAMELLLCLNALIADGTKEKRVLYAVGGGAMSAEARKIYANVFDRTVLIGSMPRNAAALGAAALALKGIGLWKDYRMLKGICVSTNAEEPDSEAVAFYKLHFQKFMLVCQQQANLQKFLCL